MKIGTTNQIVVTPPTVTVTTTSLPAGTVGVAYSSTLAASGGTPPYTWTATGVPAGLTLSTAGVLSGTPTTAATSTINVTATDSHSVASTAVALTLVVNATQTGNVVVTPSLADAYSGAAYGAWLNALGGQPPYTWAVTGAPSWMTVNTAGNISGTPTASGTVVLSCQATDSSTPANVSAVVNVTIAVNPAGQTWFGAQLPILPSRFTTTSSPPTPANTNRGSYYTPGVAPDTSLDLQGALNAAAAATGTKGDVIVLQAGTSYVTTSSFSLPVRAGSGWIYIISSHAPDIGGTGLPAAGTRVGRADIPNMASITTSATGSSSYVIQRPFATPGINYYRLVGLDVELPPASVASYVIATGSSNETAVNQLAQHITIDRCFIAGSINNGATRGIEFDGAYMEITESRIERCFSYSNGDAGAIMFGNSTGPFRVHNNWMYGGGEVTISGGFDTKLPAPTMASDFEFTNNHYFKYFTTGHANFTSGSTTMTVTDLVGELIPSLTVWDASLPSGTSRITAQLSGTTGSVGTYQLANAASATATGDAFTALSWFDKNMVEMKVGKRVLFDSNFFENALGGGQARAAFVITSINQSGGNPFNVIEDVTVTNNVFTNCYNGGMQWKLQDGAAGTYPTNPGYRYLLRNNIFMLSQPAPSGASSNLSMSTILSNLAPNGPNIGMGGHLIWDHNTFLAPVANGMHSLFFISTSTTLSLQLVNVVWSNNIWDPSQYGFSRGGGTTTPPWNYATTVPPNITQPVFTNNVTTSYTDATLPAGNFSPANVAAVGYTSYGSITAAAGYQLTTGSPYQAQGVSGLGVAYNGTGTPDGTDIGCNIANLPTS